VVVFVQFLKNNSDNSKAIGHSGSVMAMSGLWCAMHCELSVSVY